MTLLEGPHRRAPGTRPHARRARPLLLLAALALAVGSWSGLLRLGWPLPALSLSLPGLHGPLMTVSFLGTVIAVERAVALGRAWCWAAPALLALSGPAMLLGSPRTAGALAVLGGLVMSASFVPLLSRRADGYMLTMALGAASFVTGTLAWALGQPVHAAVPWWIGFVVLTVSGERWERARVLHLGRGARATIGLAVGILLAGMIVGLVDIRWGLRPLGPGLLLLSSWMLLHDVAWTGLREKGARRFLSWSLLSAHAWLGVAGVLALVIGDRVVGPHWDAVLHCVFFGYLFGMIFAHAAIILPAVAGISVQHRERFFVHLALLQVSLILRVGGDLTGAAGARSWGGLLGVLTLAVFLVNVLTSAREAKGRGPSES